MAKPRDHALAANANVVNALEAHRQRVSELWDAANALLRAPRGSIRAAATRLSAAVSDTRYLETKSTPPPVQGQGTRHRALKKDAPGVAPALRDGANTVMTAAEVVNMSVVHPRFSRNQRNAQIRAMRMDGKTLQDIGDKFGLSRARVQQICAAGKGGAE